MHPCTIAVRSALVPHRRISASLNPAVTLDDSQAIARDYDSIAYAAQSNALSHPGHLAAVAQLFGLLPPAVASCRVLEVGCSDGANLLPMAVALPGAQFVGCDLSGQAIALARQSADELQLSNVTLLQCDLAALPESAGTFDYIVAHGVYSWVPATVRDALLKLAAQRLSRNGVLFVSYNTYPGCHVRQAAWEILRRHVAGITEPRARLTAARALAALLAEPGVTQTETDALLRQEFRKLATQADSALFHDDLATFNDPVYFRDFVAHLAQHDLTFFAEGKLSMMTAAGLSPAVQQYVAGMDRLAREQYLDYARFRRFRQSLVCRADATVDGSDIETRVAPMHVSASMPLVRAAAEGKAFAGEAPPTEPRARAMRAILRWLVAEAPRIVAVAEVAAWQRNNDPAAIESGLTLGALLADACYAGTVELYMHPPPLAPVAGERPAASPMVRWQAARQRSVTNLRHETLRIDDPAALQLLTLLDGRQSREALARQWLPDLWRASRDEARANVDTALAHFAMHGLLAA
jgi:2-polyprenyl-3-methyl-5-hydroxy-6-metoxy-1,4-benzoquinol methylase